METNYSMDNIENLETKLVKLQNEVEIMKKSMALSQTGQNKDSTNDRQEYKNNSLEIKQLEKEVGEMQIKLQRQQLNDFKLMQEAMLEKCKETSDLKTSSPKEVLQKLESRVLNLSLKAQSQLQHLKHLERTFNVENEQLKKMTETSRQDDFSTEADCAQRKRYLENAQYKTVKHIEDCESANEKMKKMLKNGQKKKTSYISLLAELTKEKTEMTQNEDKDVKESRKRYLENAQYKTVKHIEDCESANEKMKKMLKNGQKKKTSYISLLAELTKEKTEMTQNEDKDVKESRKRYLENAQYKTVKHIEDCESANEKMKKMLKNGQKKKTSYISLLAELTKEKTEMTQNEDKDVKESGSKKIKDVDCEKKEKDLLKLKNEISLIKDATCCHDIYEQKATNKDLTEIAQKAEKHLIELKEEKRNLASKRALMKDVDSVYPKSDLSLAKSRLQEQQIRLDAAKEEMDRVNSHTNRTKDVFQKLIVKMNPKVNKAEMNNKKDVKQLSKQLENVVKYAFPPTKPKFAAKTKK